MNFDGFSNEAVSIFEAIKSLASNNYFTLDLFFNVILDANHRNCVAYKILSEIMLSEDLDSIAWKFNQRYSEAQLSNKFGTFDEIYEGIVKKLKKKISGVISSGNVMIEIISSNQEIKALFKVYGVSLTQLEIALKSEKDDMPTEIKSNEEKEIEEKPIIKKTKKTSNSSGDAEKNLINISELADNGEIDQAYGNGEIINKIFSVLSKRKYNNVVLVGKHGVGKTATVMHIANIISNGLCPTNFSDKTLLLMDFTKLIIGTMYKGLFETKFQNIVDDASSKGRYIFFIDDIHNILYNGTKISEMPTNTMLDLILSNKNIQFICTTTEDGYAKYILPDKLLAKALTKIELPEKTENETFSIIKNVIQEYEIFHNVSYTDKAILSSISLAKKYIKSKSLPESALDLLDESGALASISVGPNQEVEEVKSKIALIKDEIATIENGSNRIEYNKIDELTRKELTLNSELTRIEREATENQLPIEITDEYINRTITNKIGPATKISFEGEREILYNLDTKIKNVVIGQDEAVDTITKAVKRQRVGVGNPDKPVVLMMVGKTGTGKTLLAKTLAKELFGTNDSLVRLDMSEYSDKMSVNKFTGSAAGYVGYEEGGILTEAIKKKNRCVLLLDEIEKANGDIFNLLLQVFDEGRLTDNKGTLVDFKDVIIIMTSNIGAKEVSEASGRIGFANADYVKNDEAIKTKNIIRNAMKNKFTPEFLNRIDKIVWFNDLSDDDLMEIISNEIKKVSNRIEKIGYSLSKEMINGKLVKTIFEEVNKKREYGARPILREIEEKLEDKITDLILSGTAENGHIFTEEEICE